MIWIALIFTIITLYAHVNASSVYKYAVDCHVSVGVMMENILENNDNFESEVTKFNNETLPKVIENRQQLSVYYLATQMALVMNIGAVVYQLIGSPLDSVTIYMLAALNAVSIITLFTLPKRRFQVAAHHEAASIIKTSAKIDLATREFLEKHQDLDLTTDMISVRVIDDGTGEVVAEYKLNNTKDEVHDAVHKQEDV